MNLADPELELIDPTPNVHMLFIQFDKIFFYTKLASRAVVRWSKRMYSCAGICSYDRGGLCDIALSEPLLKLRPRKDLIETLLHEMIHAYLFVTCQDQDRDGHGPNFKSHMYRINSAAGLNISIYHDFHDEVKLYQTHWWRCDGPCQSRKPHFGIVRRTNNRAPGPSDYWWNDHLRKCGGTFIKIKEPENQGKKKTAPKVNNGDITKYINNKDKIKGVVGDKLPKPILKDNNMVQKNLIPKSNGGGTIVVSKKNNVVFNPKPTKQIELFSGTGHTLSGKTTTLLDIAETVRSIWANKELPSVLPDRKEVKNKGKGIVGGKNENSVSGNKHKSNSPNEYSPPMKIKKIDDYFKKNAQNVLKDIYGQDFDIKEVNSNKRLSVVAVESDLVDCPVCSQKVASNQVNQHLDECLNKDLIEKISKDDIQPVIFSEISNNVVKEIKKEVSKTNDVNPTCRQINEKSTIKNESDIQIKIEPGTSRDIKVEAGTSKSHNEQKCPCCEKNINKTMDEHLDECLAFFSDPTTAPSEGDTSLIETIEIDDDLDESLTFNATGTKSPCPCCLQMIEQADMNSHLDLCLS
ncbi:unnamed protein product [Danaus chrysippus]|uniref:Protein with SprT-like domain at the N terminus n=1 Tax=Danaus chrysippus TaxID=151541 RepID=A0A8J2R5H2_9NEOP|nr:unnamed protein product [Danaus chrysippus]